MNKFKELNYNELIECWEQYKEFEKNGHTKPGTLLDEMRAKYVEETNIGIVKLYIDMLRDLVERLIGE